MNVIDQLGLEPEDKPINILPLAPQTTKTSIEDLLHIIKTAKEGRETRKVRKDKGTVKLNMRKPHTNKRLTTKDMVEQFKEMSTKLETKFNDLVDKVEKSYHPQPAAQMSYPDKVDYNGLEKIPSRNQLTNTRSESESFRNATSQIFNQHFISTNNLKSGGLVWL